MKDDEMVFLVPVHVPGSRDVTHRPGETAAPSWMTRSIAPIFGNSSMGNRWNRTPGVLRKGFKGITR
ncbi:MAG: hypothetical protein MZU84_09035 [Sphingobacterium sp.]|nr:hypothetical protein [Sphingobacterium sp.]